ncbi:unnamed protein product [Rangifer tarandus platyrhynchus]|uniref:Uncharacterized protein n=1 Tax=Rangifer tarandus platyrhynchus TaxID=3082113 RepID=A0ACB1MJX6_RANTA
MHSSFAGDSTVFLRAIVETEAPGGEGLPWGLRARPERLPVPFWPTEGQPFTPGRCLERQPLVFLPPAHSRASASGSVEPFLTLVELSFLRLSRAGIRSGRCGCRRRAGRAGVAQRDWCSKVARRESVVTSLVCSCGAERLLLVILSGSRDGLCLPDSQLLSSGFRPGTPSSDRGPSQGCGRMTRSLHGLSLRAR